MTHLGDVTIPKRLADAITDWRNLYRRYTEDARYREEFERECASLEQAINEAEYR